MFQASNLKEKGFTLTELLVSIFIIAILSAIALANYRTGQEKLILERAATKLAQDIRRAQEMAMSAEEAGGGVPQGGYGIYLKEPDPYSYILFADKTNSGCIIPNCHKYDPGSDSRVENVFFETGVKINSLGGSRPILNIVFTPPDPSVFMGKDDEDLNSATIIISLVRDETKTKTITVNKAGLIDVVD